MCWQHLRIMCELFAILLVSVTYCLELLPKKYRQPAAASLQVSMTVTLGIIVSGNFCQFKGSVQLFDMEYSVLNHGSELLQAPSHTHQVDDRSLNWNVKLRS